MNSIELDSSAKINLSIDVIKKRTDGYHEVEMILHEIDLADQIRIEKRNSGIELSCSVSYIPADEKNIACKAARLFFEYTGIRQGAGITLQKNIPVSAGLGGGSSNAAYVLTGLNRLYDTNIPEKELWRLAGMLGSDVPFFIYGGTALCRGRGELVEPIQTEAVFDLLIVKPDASISTKDIYESFDLALIEKRPLTSNLADALKSNDTITVSKNLVNVLEYVTLRLCPEIREIKTRLLELGALNSLMSGSGSAVFGIFKNRYDATVAADKITDRRYHKYITRSKVR
jgi:4-diphosphocytidyl-2-C-methyl-D-erythritol kinase